MRNLTKSVFGLATAGFLVVGLAACSTARRDPVVLLRRAVRVGHDRGEPHAARDDPDPDRRRHQGHPRLRLHRRPHDPGPDPRRHRRRDPRRRHRHPRVPHHRRQREVLRPRDGLPPLRPGRDRPRRLRHQPHRRRHRREAHRLRHRPRHQPPHRARSRSARARS
ncbi:hypothetical protein [Clavibacter zhangzhiyongii]|uniref:hypothetical protein n=1 Tax=Clavibacter zhangzhiyongii TaxID=2768071 RepID=UPI0039DF5F1B